MLTAFILVLLIASLTGCFNDSLSGLGYKNNTYGIGLNPPEGWKIDTNDSDAIVILAGPIIEHFTVNIAITGGQINQGQTLNMIADEMIETYPTIFPNYLLISRDNRSINSMDAYEIVFTHYSEIDHLIKQKQVFIKKNTKVIILLFSATVDSYNTYNSTFEECLNSVKLT